MREWPEGQARRVTFKGNRERWLRVAFHATRSASAEAALSQPPTKKRRRMLPSPAAIIRSGNDQPTQLSILQPLLPLPLRHFESAAFFAKDTFFLEVAV